MGNMELLQSHTAVLTFVSVNSCDMLLVIREEVDLFLVYFCLLWSVADLFLSFLLTCLNHNNTILRF